MSDALLRRGQSTYQPNSASSLARAPNPLNAAGSASNTDQRLPVNRFKDWIAVVRPSPKGFVCESSQLRAFTGLRSRSRRVRIECENKVGNRLKSTTRWNCWPAEGLAGPTRRTESSGKLRGYSTAPALRRSARVDRRHRKNTGTPPRRIAVPIKALFVSATKVFSTIPAPTADLAVTERRN